MKVQITRPGDDFTNDPFSEEESQKFADIASERYADEGRGFILLDNSGIQYLIGTAIGDIAKGGRREQLEILLYTYNPLTTYVWFSTRKENFCMGTRNLYSNFNNYEGQGNL
jgi:hypothetical protein